MLVVVDIGNTNTVIGLFVANELRHHWRLQTRPDRTSDELGVLLLQLFELDKVNADTIDGAIVSCVMPTALPHTIATLKRYLHITPMVVGPGIRTQMPILYENPREVGADRIVNAVAAYERYHQGLIVVDFGTATTFDLISPRGEYLGGVITPGIRISSEALFHRTSKLPRVEFAKPDHVVGRNTVASMQAGLFYGYIAMVDGLVNRMCKEISFKTRCIATGGLATLLGDESEHIEAVHPHLTLEGLCLIHGRNLE